MAESPPSLLSSLWRRKSTLIAALALLGIVTHLVLRFASKASLNAQHLPLLITLIVVGVILWAINNYIPMDGKIKSILNIVVVVVVVLWLLQVFGLMGSINNMRVGN